MLGINPLSTLAGLALPGPVVAHPALSLFRPCAAQCRTENTSRFTSIAPCAGRPFVPQPGHGRVFPASIHIHLLFHNEGHFIPEIYRRLVS